MRRFLCKTLIKADRRMRLTPSYSSATLKLPKTEEKILKDTPLLRRPTDEELPEWLWEFESNLVNKI